MCATYVSFGGGGSHITLPGGPGEDRKNNFSLISLPFIPIS